MGYTLDKAAFKKYDAKPNDIIIFYPALFHSKFEPKSRTYNKVFWTFFPENFTFFLFFLKFTSKFFLSDLFSFSKRKEI